MYSIRKSALIHFQYLMQCECYVKSCHTYHLRYMTGKRKSGGVQQRDIFFQTFLCWLIKPLESEPGDTEDWLCIYLYFC